jgi:hypothetical protein
MELYVAILIWSLLRIGLHQWLGKRLRLNLYLLLVVAIIAALSFANYWSVVTFNEDIETEIAKLDLNGDGVFSGKEVTDEYERLSAIAINDVGRNFSIYYVPILLLFYEFLFQFVIYVIKEWSRTRRT